MKKPFWMALMSFLAAPLSGSGQEVSQDRLFVRAPVLIESLIRYPADIGEEPVPLVIGLHGGGNSPDSFIQLWDGVSNASFIYLALRAPYAVPDAPDPIYEWALWASADTVLMKRASGGLSMYVDSAIESVRRDFNVGPVYLVGFSQGAIYSYVVGLELRERLDGLIIFGGPGLLSPLSTPFIPEPVLPSWVTDAQLEQGTNLRVFLSHGRSDPAVPLELALRSQDVLRQYGYDVTVRLFEGGHELPPYEILVEVADWIAGGEGQ